jgi:Zn ribbon nucleic-acid-binding protein
MEPVAQVNCVACGTQAVISVRKPQKGEPSMYFVATNVLMPCGHHASDEDRWAGQVAEMNVAMLTT